MCVVPGREHAVVCSGVPGSLIDVDLQTGEMKQLLKKANWSCGFVDDEHMAALTGDTISVYRYRDAKLGKSVAKAASVGPNIFVGHGRVARNGLATGSFDLLDRLLIGHVDRHVPVPRGGSTDPLDRFAEWSRESSRPLARPGSAHQHRPAEHGHGDGRRRDRQQHHRAPSAAPRLSESPPNRCPIDRERQLIGLAGQLRTEELLDVALASHVGLSACHALSAPTSSASRRRPRPVLRWYFTVLELIPNAVDVSSTVSPA